MYNCHKYVPDRTCSPTSDHEKKRWDHIFTCPSWYILLHSVNSVLFWHTQTQISNLNIDLKADLSLQLHTVRPDVAFKFGFQNCILFPFGKSYHLLALQKISFSDCKPQHSFTMLPLPNAYVYPLPKACWVFWLTQHLSSSEYWLLFQRTWV